MSKKKPQLLEAFKPRFDFGVSVDIYLDKSILDFFFEFQGETYRAPNIAAIRTKAREVIDASMNLEFIKIIQVEMYERNFSRNEVLGINFHRLLIAKRPDGQWLELPWDTPDFAQKDILLFAKKSHVLGSILKDKEIPTSHSGHDQTTYILLYREELWLGLINLYEALQTLRTRLKGMLGSEEGLMMIEKSVGLLLGAGHE